MQIIIQILCDYGNIEHLHLSSADHENVSQATTNNALERKVSSRDYY